MASHAKPDNSSFNLDNSSLAMWENQTDALRYPVGIWMLVVSCIGTPANLIVLKCAHRVLSEARENQMYQYFVISMAVADLAFAGIFASSIYAMYTLQNKLSTYSCGFVYGVCHCCSVSSSLSLFCLNIDKFIAITRPLKHCVIMTGRMITRLVIGCWTIGLGWSVFFVYYMTSKHEQCGLLLAPFSFYCLFTITFFVAPNLAAFFLSLSVAVITCRHSDHVVVREPTSTVIPKIRFRVPSASRSGSSIENCRKSSAHNRPQIRRVRTLTYVFATTVWSFVTCVPYRLMYLFYLNLSEHERLNYLSPIFILFALMASNSSGNPLITILTQRKYLLIIHQWFNIMCNRVSIWRNSVSLGHIHGANEMMSRFANSNSIEIKKDIQLVTVV